MIDRFCSLTKIDIIIISVFVIFMLIGFFFEFQNIFRSLKSFIKFLIFTIISIFLYLRLSIDGLYVITYINFIYLIILLEVKNADYASIQSRYYRGDSKYLSWFDGFVVGSSIFINYIMNKFYFKADTWIYMIWMKLKNLI